MSNTGRRWVLVAVAFVAVATSAVVGFAISNINSAVESTDVSAGGETSREDSASMVEPPPASIRAPEAPEDTQVSERRLLYPAGDIATFSERMTGNGPFYKTGDTHFGGPHSPNDGETANSFAQEFLADPGATYWTQPDLPFSNGDPWPEESSYLLPMHAAWVYMTVPGHPNREDLESELKLLLLHQATDPSHTFADSEKYPITYENYAPSPIFGHAPWMTRLIKSRDMLGRNVFTPSENETIDQWFYDYANWAFNWLHHEQYAKRLPKREARDYSEIESSADPERHSYDGGPQIGFLAMDYTNRHAYVASAASLAANYLTFHDFEPSTNGIPDYGHFTVDQLLEHSRLFAEETIRFSVYPEGFQGDFERGDLDFHSADNSNVFPQRGWMYSMDVLVNLLDIASYHAARGDLSVWDYGTTDGLEGTSGKPTVGDFPEKNLHFFAWSMLRYLNGAWERTNFGEPLALSDHYHGVIHAAIASRFAPGDQLFRDAWRRSGSDFPPYPSSPIPQGIYHAHRGGYGRYIGVIEQAGASNFGE